MQRRFGHDFARVRVHTETSAPRAVAALDASAYTVGADIVFAAGQFAPGSSPGDQVLAHELVHVIQQSTATDQGRPPALETDANLEDEATSVAARGGGDVQGRLWKPAVQRQPPAPPVPATSQASADLARYQPILTRAVAEASGALVDHETFTGIVQPILLTIIRSPTWIAADGTRSPGAPTRVPLPGLHQAAVTLLLELDDNPNPSDLGHFQRTGVDAAVITISVRRNPDPDTLLLTLYHECMHLVTWLLNQPTPALQEPRFARRERGLKMGLHEPEVPMVAGSVEDLARSVNARRPAGERAMLSPNEVNRVARFLIEEVRVRAETEVFRRILDEQRAHVSYGAHALLGTRPYAEVNRDMVDRYVFEFGSSGGPPIPLFRDTDKRSLSQSERHSLDTLAETMEGIFQSAVRQRCQRPLVETPVPRAPVIIPLAPLAQPTFPDPARTLPP